MNGAQPGGGAAPGINKATEAEGVDLVFPSLLQYFHKTVGHLLPLAYTLLKRNLFAEIIEQHLGNRREEDLDQLAP